MNRLRAPFDPTRSSSATVLSGKMTLMRLLMVVSGAKSRCFLSYTQRVCISSVHRTASLHPTYRAYELRATPRPLVPLTMVRPSGKMVSSYGAAGKHKGPSECGLDAGRVKI